MKRFGFGIAATALLLMSACLEAPQAPVISRQIPVTSEFSEGTLSWGGLPGRYHYLIDVIAVNGIIEVCGVGYSSDAYTRSNERQVFQGAKFTMNGRSIMRDLSYFSSVTSQDQLRTAQANCRSTGVAAPSGDATFNIEGSSRRYSF